MWIFTKQGFFSATNHAHRPDVIHLRARYKGDIEKLFKETGSDVREMIKQDVNATIHKANANDLGYYCDISKEVWVAICASVCNKIDYSYFSDVIKKGSGREKAYSQVYNTMLKAKE